MKAIRRAGYSVRWATPKDATSALGVPISADGELLGSLVCSTYPKSLNERRVRELKPELQKVASDIALQWRARQHELAARPPR
jgi:DNA-binding IclR family transcriptional regulator